MLAAYCDVLYVDRRTAEDLLRVQRKEPILDALMGEVRKAADIEALLEKKLCWRSGELGRESAGPFSELYTND